VAVVGLMFALGGWSAPPEPLAKPGFAPCLAEWTGDAGGAPIAKWPRRN